VKDAMIETLRRTVERLEPHREALAAAWAASLADVDPDLHGDPGEDCARALELLFSRLAQADLEGLLDAEGKRAHEAARRGASFRSEALAIRTLDRCCLPFLLDGIPERAELAEAIVALDELADRRLELLLQAQEDESARRLIEAQEQAAAASERARALQQANEALRRAEARAENRADQVALLAEVARRVVGLLDPQLLLQEAADAIQGRGRYRYTAVVMLNSEGRLVGRWSGRGGIDRRSGGRTQGPPGGIIGRAIRRRAPQVVPDVGRDPDYHADVPGTASELVVPLIEEGKVVGALDFQSDRPGAFDLDDVVAAEAIAEFVVIALRNARLLQESRGAGDPGPG
jgi:hypothetical protein